jgi:hypothetical protein
VIPVALLRSPVPAIVREVGVFGEASTFVVLEIGEVQLRVPATLDEARALGSQLNLPVTLRIAVQATAPAPEVSTCPLP